MVDDISILLLGAKSFPLLSRLINLDDKRKYYVHCFNTLDYKVLPKKKNTDERQYRAELRRAFRLLKETDTTTEHLDLLRSNDYLGLDDIDLEINLFIYQAFSNQPDYTSVYKFLSGDLSKENIRLAPLIEDPVDIVVHKAKKLAPIRYYYQTKDLLKINDHEYFDSYRNLEVEEDLALYQNRSFDEIDLGARSEKYLHRSKFMVILVSDLISLAVFSKMTNVLNELKNAHLPIILIWPPELSKFDNFAEKDIFELLGLGNTMDKVVDNLATKIDYIISANSEAELGEILLESGYQVENNKLPDPINSQNSELKEFLMGLTVEEEEE